MQKFLVLVFFPYLVFCGCPNITSRSEWGAKSPLESTALAENPPPFVVVHHSATPECLTEDACKRRVKNIQYYHMEHNEWDDIGYNFLIGGDGNVYEGRGWGKLGTHAPKYNSKSIGVCLIGDFMNKKPPESQLQALRDLISCGLDQNTISSEYHLIGHRQARRTACPGDVLFNEIKTWSHFDPDIHL